MYYHRIPAVFHQNLCGYNGFKIGCPIPVRWYFNPSLVHYADSDVYTIVCFATDEQLPLTYGHDNMMEHESLVSFCDNLLVEATVFKKVGI